MISALRALRLFRLIKLVRNNYTLRCLLDSIAETLSQVANFMVILAIFIYVFSLLGMEIFAGKFMFDSDGNFDDINGELSRQNYDEILWAIITVF
jgi:voltage-dependent calcium channel L type alpha-1D